MIRNFGEDKRKVVALRNMKDMFDKVQEAVNPRVDDSTVTNPLEGIDS